MSGFISSAEGDIDRLFVKIPEIESILGNSSGLAYVWGQNLGSGVWGTILQLGLGTATNYSSPVQIGSLTDWKKISAHSLTSFAIKDNGTLWSWGDNTQGQLGLGNTAQKSSPTQVGTLTNWKDIDCGSQFAMAIKTDGALWTWGWAYLDGMLGLGDTSTVYSPVQVGTLTNWSQVSCGERHTSAVKTDGTLWAWGRNDSGRLGLGDTTNRSSPVQVGVLTDWSQVSCGYNHTVAIKTNGTLWAWGSNIGSGALGLGNTTNQSSPVQIGLLTTWSTVSAGSSITTAIKTDGTLWAWGGNGVGQLGLGDTTTRSSPVQVGMLTNWKLVILNADNVSSFAVKIDGTLWAWGDNSRGTLGLGATTPRSSPVQVGSLNTWKTVASTSYHSVALKYTS